MSMWRRVAMCRRVTIWSRITMWRRVTIWSRVTMWRRDFSPGVHREPCCVRIAEALSRDLA
jgi:hypothetical protein